MKTRVLIWGTVAVLFCLGLIDANRSWSEADAVAAPSPDRLLALADERYFAAEIDQSLEILDQLLNVEGLSMDQRVDAHLLQAYCYTALNHPDPAKRAIRSAWEVKNALEVDPERVPPRFMYHYYNVLKELGVDDPIQTLAVLDFTNTSITDHEILAPLARGIPEMLQIGLLRVPNITLVERERIGYILKELEMQEGDGFEARSASRLGNLLAVRYILTGSFSRIGDDLRVTYRLDKVETAEVLDGGMVDGKAMEIMGVIADVGEGVVELLSRAMPVETSKWKSEHVDPEALLLFSEGLVLMDHQRYGEARAKFLLANAIDPRFDPAAERAQQLAVVAALEDEAARTPD